MLKDIIANLNEFESAVMSATDFIDGYAEDENDGAHHLMELNEGLSTLHKNIEKLESLSTLLEQADTALAEGALAAGEAGAIDAQEQIGGVRASLSAYGAAASPGKDAKED